MKIYQLLHFPLRGAGTGIYADNLARVLAERGHQVKTLCADHYLPEKEYPVEAVLFNNGENEIYDLDFNFPVFASHPLSRGKNFGELTASERETYTQAFREKIEHEVSTFKPDIIHVHHGWVIASILADLDTPYVITFHGTDYHAFNRFEAYQALTRRGVQGAAFVIPLSEQEREQAIEAYEIEHEKTIIVTSGTNTEVFKPMDVDKGALLKSYSIENTSRPVVFFGGRLTTQKGVDTLLRAAQIYSQMDAKPLTLIAGDGDLKVKLKALASELGLSDTYFLGNQTHAQMVALFNIADVVAYPSIFDPFPLTAMEAMACGAPIIGGNVGGFREMISEDVGCLVEPGDYKTWAEKITVFIETDFKKEAHAKAVARARRLYSWENTVTNTEKVYERVLKKTDTDFKQSTKTRQ